MIKKILLWCQVSVTCFFFEEFNHFSEGKAQYNQENNVVMECSSTRGGLNLRSSGQNSKGFFMNQKNLSIKNSMCPFTLNITEKKRKWKKLPPRNIRCWVVGSNQILQNHSKKLFHMKWLGKKKRCIVKWHEVCQELP